MFYFMHVSNSLISVFIWKISALKKANTAQKGRKLLKSKQGILRDLMLFGYYRS